MPFRLVNVTQSRARDYKHTVLKRICSAVGSRYDVHPVLETAVNELGNCLAVSRCLIYQPVMGGLQVTHEYYAEEQAAIGAGNTVVLPAVYLAHQTAQTVKADNVLNDERLQDPIGLKLFKETGVRSVIALPMMFQSKALGIVEVQQCDRVRRWSADDVDLLETAAAQLALIMQSCHSFQEQENMADSLARMNQDLSRLYVELAGKDQQLDRFMHLISHDLRAPVVAIHGLVELLQQHYIGDPPDSKPRRYLEQINRSSEQITNLTGMLLEYARLGQSTVKLQDVNTAELVREVWQRLSILAEHGRLEIFSELPVVRADKTKLGQIFQNLLENSIKYKKPDADAVVDITAQETDSHWQFAINDDGIGFQPSDAEHIFDLFSRLKEARHRPGTGIGLASVFELARLHGGSAWAIGRPGKGSTFYFTIAKDLKERPKIAGAAI